MNMTYCMWRNASNSLIQLIEDTEDALDRGESLKEYTERRGDIGEQYAIKATIKQCQELIDILGTMQGIQNEL